MPAGGTSSMADAAPVSPAIPADFIKAVEDFRPVSTLCLPQWRAWLCSLAFHGLLAGGMATITLPAVTHIRTEEPELLPARLKIGDKLYFVARMEMNSPERSLTAPRTAPAAKTPVRQQPKPEIQPPEPPQKPRAQPPRIFAPPEVRRNPLSEATMIQPLSPPDVAFPDQPLPAFEVQSPRTLRIPKPFLVPGRPAPQIDTAAPVLPPPPQIETARAAPVDFAPRSTLVLQPALPPVVDERPPELKLVEAPQIQAGDPVSILSASARPMPAAPEIVVPPGNVVGRTGEQQALLVTEGPSPSEGSKRPVPESPLPGAGPPGEASTERQRPAPAPARPNQIRRPREGQFDAVVVQSSPTDQFPESRGLLTGRPIYSVYVSLGTAKDWTLYFCVPGSAPSPQNQTPVVTLEPATPVLAPYPTLLEKPAVTIPAFFKYVLVHARVNEEGRFQNLRVVRPTRPEADRALLAALSNWEFRPASRQGSKIAVEVLLYIPVEGL